MITRRGFGAGLMGIATLVTSGNEVVAAQRKPRKNALMHVGGYYDSVLGGDITSKQNLEYNLRHGVKHLTAEVGKRL